MSPSDLRHAINREKQLMQQRKIAEKEMKAKKKLFEKEIKKEAKRRAKAGNNRIERAELAMGAPVAILHPSAPHTSTPNRVTLDQLKEGLRCAVQENSSFGKFNGQPSLRAGAWPDSLGDSQTKRAYRRNLKMAKNRYPEVAEDMYDPEAFAPEAAKPEMKGLCGCPGRCQW